MGSFFTLLVQNISLVAGIILLMIIGVQAFILVERKYHIRDLHNSLNKLKNSFNDLDKQAKLIVNTDLELNKAQEELDKRLNGLDALHEISRLISTSLDEQEIFNRLNQTLLVELGFEKYLIGALNKKGSFHKRVELGFGEQAYTAILEQINAKENLKTVLQERQIISSVKNIDETTEELARIFGIKHFIMAPILAQKELLGFAFAGNQSDAFAVTEGDEEIVSILSSQIGQAIENARLFEEVYRTSQSLEIKVQERTRQLTKVLEDVKQISKNKSDFISAVSHELRTPLTSIKGYASILMTGKVGALPEKVIERLEKINKHSDNLVKLINDLLDISRIESGRRELKFVRHKIISIVEDVQDLLTPQMKEKNIRFLSQVESSIPEVLMDASQVERVFINLIGNAIKFTPEDGVITTQIIREEKRVVVSVNDTGIGIKEEDIARLFNEFYRVDNEINQNVKGSGLGLALAKKIVEAHHGEMWVTSQLGKGTTFSFSLPLENWQETVKV